MCMYLVRLSKFSVLSISNMRISSGQALQKSLSGLVTRPLSGQVMHASGVTENVIRIVLLKNRVCQGTRMSYGTLGCHPALNSPGLYFVFKCSIHLSHPCSTGFSVQNSDGAVQCWNMN